MAIAFVPLAIEVLGHQAELDDEVGREVLRPDLAPLFLPQAEQGLFVLAHDDAGVRAADEVPAVSIGTAPSVGSIHLLKHDNFTPS
jgi:hypothetical protein